MYTATLLVAIAVFTLAPVVLDLFLTLVEVSPEQATLTPTGKDPQEWVL